MLATVVIGTPVAAARARPVARAAACTKTVAFELIEATTTGCLNEVSAGQWTSTDAVKLNGVPLVPVRGTQLALSAPTDSSPGGKLSVNTSIAIAGVTFEKQGLLSFNLPAGGKGDEKTLVSTPTLNGQKLFGFDISGSAEIRIGWDATNDLRYVKFIGNLALPSIFKNGPEQGAGGLTATVGLRVDKAGVHADAVKAQVSNAYIGPLLVKDLCLSYLGAGSTSTTPCSPPLHGAQRFLECQEPGNVSRWDGTAEVVLPTADRPEVGVWAGVQSGLFSYAGGRASNLGNSVPIASGVYLNRVALAVCVRPQPLKFKGEAGIHLGPVVNGKTPLAISGSLEFINSRPWVIEARGSVEVLGEQIAHGFVRYQSDNTIDFGLGLNLDFKVASVEAGLNGWIEARRPARFNLDGHGKVCVKLPLVGKKCAGAEVTASSAGIAGCFKFGFVRVGIGKRWGETPKVMASSCDVGPFRAVRSARAAALGVHHVIVPAGAPALALKAKGLAGPPGVELIAPNGARFTSPAAPLKLGLHEIFMKDSSQKTTEVLIANPPAGSWTVRGLPGSLITAVQQATVTRPPDFTAHVAGTHFERVLSYSYRAEPRHATRFVEVGATYEQELGAATRRPCPPSAHRSLPLCGQIHFTPAAGPSGARHIYAITTINGEIVHKQLVATYHAPPRREPSIVPRLSVQRAGSTVTIHWAGSTAPERAAKAVAYNVGINLSDGRRILDVVPASGRSVTVPNVAPQTTARVSVSGMRNDDTQGRTRTVHLAAGARTASS
jgi:hypothetical protein